MPALAEWSYRKRVDERVYVYVEKAPAYVAAAKILLAAAGPAQRLVQGPALTHFMCNRQALKILGNDGHQKAAKIAGEYSEDLDKGVSWADCGFKNMSHFMNPGRNKGIYGWTDAVRECSLFWNKALQNWQDKNYEKAFFYLGAAAHLVQDVCVPHHARGILFDGHLEYEEWAAENRNNYKVTDQGIYDLGEAPGDWIRANSLFAQKHYYLVGASSIRQDYHKATQALLTRAQRVTAGFLSCFFRKVGI
ncbi:MAG: zinc dependent phospholipase C family protein [Thermincola sp.]|nr:zinc dependent phospholipase C family protein [Thermincola sp.]MDT3702344.1 zinc dependent phospholipase C family protein [Thermincola sp.]